MASDSVALSTVFVDLKIQIGSHSHKKSPYSIICDAWYGFPTQKRPRKERILAVSKQIHNFNTWRATRNANFTNEKNAHAPISNVYVIGSVDDVNSIRDRVQALNGVSDCDDNADSKDEETKVQVATATATATATNCMFMPGMKLEDLSKELSKTIQVEVSHSETGTGTGTETETGTGTETSSKKFISYLSPDADIKLKASQIPPQIVIVGMLVDRKVQPNRSRKRAESLLAHNGNSNGKQTARTSTSTFSCSENPNVNGGEEEQDDETQMIPILPTQLPLDALNVQELSADEPLNIDTVMEILERWWQHSHNEDRIGSETQRVRNFKDAAARALLTHRQRHPNRVVHGGASKMG